MSHHSETIIRFAPTRYDVIARRGGYRSHPGNVFYHKLLDKCVRRRQIAQQDLDITVDAILDVIIRKRSGRFVRPLEEDKAFAVVLDRKTAALKVRTDLRSWRTRMQVSNLKDKQIEAASEKRLTARPQVNVIPQKRTDEPTSNVSQSAATEKTTNKAVGHSTNTNAAVGGKIHLYNLVTDNAFVDECDTQPSQPSAKRACQEVTLFMSTTSVPDRVSFQTSVTTNYSSKVAAKCTASQDDPTDRLLYGSVHDEIHMRRWLNTNQLPQSVAVALLELGARNVEDVILLVKTKPKLLEQLTVLDIVKLHRAVDGK